MQAQKVETIGVPAGGIAHDFNNILSALMGFTDLAKMKAHDDEIILNYLNSISSAILRARALARRIKSINPKIPVVLCTGFSHRLTKEMWQSAGVFDLLMKPLIAGELSMAVDTALKKSAGEKDMV